MALLFRHFPANSRGLRHQFLLPSERRNLRQPISALSSYLEAKWGSLHPDATNQLPNLELNATSTRHCAARKIQYLPASSSVGGCKDADFGEWKTRGRGSRPRKIF